MGLVGEAQKSAGINHSNNQEFVNCFGEVASRDVLITAAPYKIEHERRECGDMI